jgi:DNA repair protein RecN (Recombination protein N)
MQATRSLEPVADREREFGDVLEMLGTARVNVEESIHALTRIGDELEADPERLDAVDRRLGRTMELARKHRREPEALPELRKELRQRLERIDGAAEARDAAVGKLEEARQAWLDAARALHEERRRVADRLVGDVGRALADLGMEQARLEFMLEFDEQADVASHGADRVDILFSANPGQPPRSLKRVASGGELSRLSLAMIIASAEPAAGLVRIFDEIDAGVGGETAHKVGEFLHRAGEGGQAFCVTHLAQVAARADQQFRVIKRADGNRTRVTVERLDEAARIAELARMLGSATGETSRKHAEALLSGSSRPG